jgi:hypothetical protein
MNLRPEQERALAYARRRGTDAPLAEIVSRLAATYADFEALLEPIPAATARTRPAPGSWCVQEIVDHLLVSDQAALEQLQQLLAGESPNEPIPAGFQSPRPLVREWPGLVADFRLLHQRVLDLLGSASDDVPLLAQAPVEMVVKCADPDGGTSPVHWLETFDWKAFAILVHAHNREHIAQVQRALARSSRSEVGELERRHREGYERHPVRPGEFDT